MARQHSLTAGSISRMNPPHLSVHPHGAMQSPDSQLPESPNPQPGLLPGLRSRLKPALPWLMGIVAGAVAVWALQTWRSTGVSGPSPTGTASSVGRAAAGADSPRHPGSSASLPEAATGGHDLAAAATASAAPQGDTGERPDRAPGQEIADKSAGPLRIIAEPATLRVWSNTAVRLRVEVLQDVEFDKFIWHFEDGSAAVQGMEVEHTFAESVRDRHVTVEGVRRGQPAVVATRRLAVERLEVVPLDGGEGEVKTPAKRGTRLLVVVAASGEEICQAVAAAAAQAQVDAVVAVGEPPDIDALEVHLGQVAPAVPLLRWSIEPPGDGQQEKILEPVKDPNQQVTDVQIGDKSSGVFAIGDLALVAIDTRGETVGEPELKRAKQAMTAASAYPGTLLLTARPLTLLRDGELIADRAYRIYEHALRQAVTAVVSATSEVFYDGRFGGLALVAVGRARLESCPRLTGQDACQQPSVTLLELGEKKRLQVLHLMAPTFTVPAQSRDLPAEVGKVRR